MRTCHSVSWLLTGFICSVVCADSETVFGKSVIDKVDGVVGGNAAQGGRLASVSPPLQHRGVPQSRGPETRELTQSKS